MRVLHQIINFIDSISQRKPLLQSIVLVGFVFKLIFLDVAIGDYKVFLEPWINFIKSNGYEHSLKYNFYNYSPAYIYYLIFIAKLGINPLYGIKFFSILFDYVLAFFVGKIAGLHLNSRNSVWISLAIVPLIPTVFFNSAYLSQCDSIYSAFVIIALYFSFREHSFLSVFFIGIALTFKLQAIFILPYFFVLMLRKKIPFYYFLVVPLIFIVSLLPAYYYGRPITDLLNIYVAQSNQYEELTLNFPNLYIWFGNGNDSIVRLSGIVLTVLLTCTLGFVLSRKKIYFTLENWLGLALLSCVVVPYILPGMHERYMYLGDVLSVLYFITFRRKIIFPIGVIFISLYSYVRTPVRYNDLLVMEPVFFLYSLIVFLIISDFVIRLKNTRRTCVTS